jgi:hypothetical protein
MKMNKKIIHISLAILVCLFFIKTKVVAIGYSSSDYYSVHQKSRSYSYKNASGETINQTRIGYKDQNNLDSISIYGTTSFDKPLPEEYGSLTQLSEEKGTEHNLFKYYIPAGTKKIFRVASSLTDNFSEFVFVARIGTSPGDYVAYARSLSEADFLKLPSENGFTISQLKAGDCIGRNSVGYIFVANDQISAPTSGGVWLYVQYIRRNGNASSVYTSFENNIDTSAYLSWYNSYNNWQSNGDPVEDGSCDSSCASSTCTGVSCYDQTTKKYIQGTKTTDCSTVSPSFNPGSINLSAQSATSSNLSWTSTNNPKKMQFQCTGPKVISQTETDIKKTDYLMSFDKVAKGAKEGSQTEACLFQTTNQDDSSGTPSSVNLTVNINKDQLSQDGQCGSAAKSYSTKTKDWGSYADKFCNQGTASPVNPIFPTESNPTNWTCLKVNNGDDANCTATIRSSQSADDCLSKATTKYVCCPDNPDCVDTTCKNSTCYDGCKYVPGELDCQ